MPADVRAKISASIMKPDAGRNAIHQWINRKYPRSGVCEDCGDEGRTHYASINGHRYTRNREDYAELCQSCHLKRDYAEGRRRSQTTVHRCEDCGSLNVGVVHRSHQ